jgi:hypothetical protein
MTVFVLEPNRRKAHKMLWRAAVPVRDHGARGEYSYRTTRKVKHALFRGDRVFITWLRTHPDRVLHGQDFSTHVAAVTQATVGGICLVAMVDEIGVQIKEPASCSRSIPAACGLSRPTVAYLVACSSLLLLAASCEIGGNPRFFTVALFAVTEDISGNKTFTEQSVIQ